MKTTSTIIIALAFAIIAAVTASRSKTCMTRGQCAKIDLDGGSAHVPCAVEAGPINPLSQLDSKTRETFSKWCPTHYQSLINSNAGVCCDADQIVELMGGVEHDHSLLGSCPSCARNFIEFFCHLACDADQSSYMNITKTTPSTMVKGGRTVVEVEVSMAESFREGLFDSCKNVKFQGRNAMDSICHSTDCNADKMFTAIASYPDYLFNVSLNWAAGPAQNVMGLTPLKCSEAPTRNQWPERQEACSCADCPDSC